MRYGLSYMGWPCFITPRLPIGITGGTYDVRRIGNTVTSQSAITKKSPYGLPPSCTLLTRLIPSFRTWPTTYTWTKDHRPCGQSCAHGKVEAGGEEESRRGESNPRPAHYE